jgi:peptidoglycan-N-acetylglucosamine deacetylase
VRVRSLIIGAVALAAGVSPAVALAAGASPAVAHVPRVPPIDRADVHSAALVQTGRSLVWTTTLVHGISRRGIAARRRQVCLQLLAPRAKDLKQTVCLSAPANSTRLGLTRTSWHGNRAGATHPLPGTVTRSDAARTITATFSPVALGLPYRSLRWQVRSEATHASCPITAPVDGGARHHVCVVTYPAKAALASLHTPQLVGCVPAGPSFVSQGPGDKREIALAFDDGPWWQPPAIDFVNELKRLGVPGTFFEIGEQIREFDPTGSVERAMLADGDMIGNHTWTHPNMATLSPAQQTTELEQTNEAIRRATGFTPCLWRAPYGGASPALETLARSLGLITIGWDIDPRDWALPGTSAIVATVLEQAQNGGITVMHFGGGPREQTLEALPRIVADLRAHGYRFVNVVQMLGLREIWR